LPDLFADVRKIPNERQWYLIGKDAKGKIRVCYISYEFIDDERIFIIHRCTGQLHGKLTEQPDKVVERGKASRNLWQQVELESLHLVKEKLDKGYKELEKDPDKYTDQELFDILGKIVTGQNNVPKPMLAKQADKVTNTKIFDKEWYASRKIDGLRALIYMGDDNRLHTSSRGAMNYDAAMTEILNNQALIDIFKKYPGLIMDGECYHHGYSLQQLNSIARTQKTAVDYEVLQFYWYDIVDTTKSFKERFKLMNEIKEELCLQFQPEIDYEYGDLRIQFVPQTLVSGWDNILKLHNNYVEEGWEGLVIRDPNKPYKPNGRTNDMIKVKQYSDMEVTVIGYELGLRGSEDMVFKCVLDNGIEFLAKPFGDRQLKESYIRDFEDLYKGKKATIKYFYLSDTGVPLQPSLKVFRLEEDMQ
jgi:hypothetical protein